MHVMDFKISIMIFWLFVVQPLSAQSDKDIINEKVSINFSTLKVGKGAFDQIRYFTKENEASLPLEFKLVRRSGPYSYTGLREMSFIRTVPAPTVEDPNAVRFKLLARVNIPKGWRDVLFFFEELSEQAAVENNGLPYKVHMMNDSFRAFPVGSLIVFNATGRLLAGSVGGERGIYKDGPSKKVDFANKADGRISCAFAVKTTDGPKLVFESDLEYSERYRVILMLSPPRREGSIRIEAYSIPQFIEEAIVENT